MTPPRKPAASGPATSRSEPPPAPGGLRLGYHPGLDGIRAVSILLVMLFHYSWNGRSLVVGGFLGVDTFFVLSGFLITTLLLQERRRARRVSLRNFYLRRALRLLPLAAVLCLVGVFLNLTQNPSFAGRPERQGILATAFYYANWMRIDRPQAMGILAHAWSLSIEEQFYLVWPLALLGLLACRLRARGLVAAVSLAVAGSAIGRAVYWQRSLGGRAPSFVDFYLTFTNRRPLTLAPVLQRAEAWDRTYFGSDTRADALLLGCLLALVLFYGAARLTPRVRHLVGWLAVGGAAGIAGIVVQARIFRSAWLLSWGLLVFEVCVALVIAGVLLQPRAPLGRLLALGPLVWIGRRSYGLYIVHWPVFVLTNPSHLGAGDWTRFLVAWGVTFGLAALSFRFFEGPILALKDRFGDRPARA